MSILRLVIDNLTSPPVLAFALGLIAVGLGTDLRLRPPVASLISTYLLLAIGLKGWARAVQGVARRPCSSGGRDPCDRNCHTDRVVRRRPTCGPIPSRRRSRFGGTLWIGLGGDVHRCAHVRRIRRLASIRNPSRARGTARGTRDRHCVGHRAEAEGRHQDR